MKKIGCANCMGAPILLDLTAAFDTVDLDIVAAPAANLQRIGGFGRISSVRSLIRGVLRSLITRLLCGVPRGTVHGPFLFILYTFATSN